MRSDSSGVSERLFQEGVQYFINHPDKWVSRRELQEALGIKKTQACRLITILSKRLCLDDNDPKEDNSPLYLMLKTEHLKSATKELASISTLTDDDRRILSIIMDMAESSGLYGDMIKDLKRHIELCRFVAKGIIPVTSYSPQMMISEREKSFIPTLLQAISESKSVWITYKSPWAEKEKHYTVNPIGLFTQNDILFLYSYNSYFGHTLVHAVSRIIDVSLYENATTPEEYKDLSRVLDPFGIAVDDEPTIVTAWIDPEQAYYEKESLKTKDATITENPDGSIIIKIQTRNIFACKRWILGLGCMAKCIGPRDLVDEIEKEIATTLKQYQAN